MRILHISTRLILGGSQENTVLSCEGQTHLGHEVHLAYGPIYGPEGSMLDRVSRPGSPIRTHEVPHLLREVSPLADPRAYRELRALIRTIQPDVVHTHSSKAGILGRAAAWAERTHPSRAGRPLAVIHTIHGPPFMPVEPLDPPISRLKTALNNRLYQTAERFAANRCHLIVSIADAMTRQFLRRGIGRPAQYVTVYSGMEVDRFLNPEPGEDRASVRSRLGLADSDFVIGTVARLAQHKGHDDLIDALADDLRTHPSWKLLWVGDGWWRKRLEERLTSLSLRNRAILTGLVPPEQVPGLIRAMDVLVHPSTREGLPRTVPQAHLCGVIPIAYACDGAPEAIHPLTTGSTPDEGGHTTPGDRATGILITPTDHHQLRWAVSWAAANPAPRRAMADRGRIEAAERFSAQRMVDELERVYQTALTAAARHPA